MKFIPIVFGLLSYVGLSLALYHGHDSESIRWAGFGILNFFTMAGLSSAIYGL